MERNEDLVLELPENVPLPYKCKKTQEYTNGHWGRTYWAAKMGNPEYDKIDPMYEVELKTKNALSANLKNVEDPLNEEIFKDLTEQSKKVQEALREYHEMNDNFPKEVQEASHPFKNPDIMLELSLTNNVSKEILKEINPEYKDIEEVKAQIYGQDYVYEK